MTAKSSASLFQALMNSSVRLYGIAICCFLLVTITDFRTDSQGLASFDCDGTIYFSLNIGSNFTQIATLDFETMTFEYLGEAHPRFNGMGVNPIDGLIYATVPNTGEIYRIDANGNFVSLGLATGDFPSGSGWVSGAFLPDGLFVINQSSDGYIVVIEGLETGRPEVVSSSEYGQGNYIDLVYNPNDGLLYGYEKRDEFRLTVIDPYTGETTFVGASNESINPPSGGMAFDSEGNLFSIGGSSIDASNTYGIYQFDIDPNSATYGLSHLVGRTDHPSGGVDAASCYY